MSTCHARLAAVGGLVCSLGWALPAWGQSGLARVWAVDDGEKVRADDLDHWAISSRNNAVWDGSTIRIFAGRNEVVAFQLILEASAALCASRRGR